MQPRKFEVRLYSEARKEVKHLAKKYPSFYDDLLQIQNSLSENPTQGVSIGQGCYKIRFAIKSKGKGKSGGARMITWVVQSLARVSILSVYDKSQKEDLDPGELKWLIDMAEAEDK
jgi:mRNA-degrading endonuclease RelE of RelBE toxin-antitoxin system